MDSLSSFLDMGGYGAFVWPSFGLSALLLTGVLVISVRTLRSNRRALLDLENSDQGRAPQGISAK